MEKTNFWNDAAKYGAIIALVSILLGAAELYWNMTILSALSTALFIFLIYFFTKRRVILYGADGYSYGQCMKYIFWMMVFAGIIKGAWEIVARNVLFKEQFEEAMNRLAGAFAGFYSGDQLADAVNTMQTVMFSPIWIVVASILGMVIGGCFFGLFISALVKKDAPVFSDKDN